MQRNFKYNQYNIIIYLFLFSSFCSSNLASNIAFRKKLDYAPEPNYRLTEHTRDSFILTDGVKGDYSWYREDADKTVGWHNKHFIEIKIDIEGVYDIDYVKLHSVGPYPDYILVMSSLDDHNYNIESLFSTHDWGPFDDQVSSKKGYGYKEIKSLVKNKARYIRIILRPKGGGLFLNEIEIISSEYSISKKKNIFCPDNTGEIIAIAERSMQLHRNISYLLDYVDNLEYIADYKSKVNEKKKTLLDFFQNFSISNLVEMEYQIDCLRASVVKSIYFDDWIVYESDPLKTLLYEELPSYADPNQFSLSFYQWKNESSFRVFNILNVSNKTLTFNLSVAPIAKEKKIYSNSFFDLRRSIYVYCRATGYFADPLVKQDDKPFTLRPGETSQICLDFNSYGLDSGDYTSAVAVECQSQVSNKTKVIQIEISISDKVFPDKMDFMTCSWDNLTHTDNFTKDIIEVAKKDLSDNHINVSTLVPGDIYEEGKVSRWLVYRFNQRDFAKIKLLSLGLGSQYLRFGEDVFSKKWQTNFKSFFTSMVDLIKKAGYSYTDYAVYPYDEYLGDKFIHVARLIREINPEVQIYANSIGGGIDDIQKAEGLIDILCLPFNKFLFEEEELLNHIKNNNYGRLWSYETFSRNRLVHPKYKMDIHFHRLMPIYAVSLGLEGAGFWVYSIDFSKGMFNDYNSIIWNVVYDGTKNRGDWIEESIIPSKRWLNWRLGVQDAVALMDHKDLLEEFYNKAVEEITSDYLTSLRKRADKSQE